MMREQLTQYVNLLFAGASDCEEIRMEILQNTLDRYDDLIAQGKTPEAAYRLAISGIGDINEILSSSAQPQVEPAAFDYPYEQAPVETPNTKMLRAIAIAMYIICPLPLFIIQNEIGLCLLLVMVAVATGILVFIGKHDDKAAQEDTRYTEPQKKLRKSASSLISTITLIIYFIISFSTGAWHITWLIFPLAAAVKGLITACIDLKEGN